MLARDFRVQAGERQRLFQAQLPQRLAWLRERGERLAPDCRDLNALHRMAVDAAMLAVACRAAAANALAEHLDALHAAIAPLLDPPHLPDRACAAQITALIAGLAHARAPTAITAHDVAPLAVVGPTREAGFPLLVTPPQDYWTRFVAPPASTAADASGEAANPVARADPVSATAARGDANAEARDVARDDDASVENEDLVERIRSALAGHGFELAFQPIMSLRGEEHEQFQALLRLRGDATHATTAAEVIPSAIRAGLIGAVDRWVLEHCLGLLAGYRGRSGVPRLFVSQSLDSVRDRAQPAWLDAQLRAHGVDATALSLEVRSCDAAIAAGEVARHAAAMGELGASLTLTGIEGDAADQRLLRMLPVAFIKLAPRYLGLDDATLREELHALVEFAHANGQRVIAPRVEDARGVAALCNAGVDFIQGNFVQQAGAGFAFDFQSAVM